MFAGGAIDYDVGLLTGCSLILNQFWAMLNKKIIYTIRNWVILIMQNLIPVSFLVIGMLVARSFRGQSVLPSLEISLGTYERSYTILEKTSLVVDNTVSSRLALP